MHRAAVTAAKNLRRYLDALSLDLAACSTAAETRAVKVAIRQAELELMAVGQ